MLLALDAGNTNVAIGVYEGSELRMAWRLRTDRDQTADEWGIKLRQLFTLGGLRLEDVDGMIIASVVPPVDVPLAEMCRRYFDRSPMFVSIDLDLGPHATSSLHLVCARSALEISRIRTVAELLAEELRAVARR